MRSRPLISSRTSSAPAFSAVLKLRSTVLGPIALGLVWSETGIIGLTFPEASETNVQLRLQSAWPGARRVPLTRAPKFARAAAAHVSRYLKGEKVSLNSIPLDLSYSTEFRAKVYTAARAIGRGCTSSYGELADVVGSHGAARAVGQAMAKNPFPIIVPCHRILASSQKIGGFTAPGGLASKRSLLELEGYRQSVP